MPLQRIAHVIETDAMAKLGMRETNDMAPRTERARLIFCARSSRDPLYLGLWNKLADLAQDGEVRTCWFDFFLFHPCLVAGLKLQTNTFLYKSVGRL